MKKNAIIDIISNDLKEMQLLLDSFKDFEHIPADFIELLETKHNSLYKEIHLLNFWATNIDTQLEQQASTQVDANVDSKKVEYLQEPVEAKTPIVEEKIDEPIQNTTIAEPEVKQIIPEEPIAEKPVEKLVEAPKANSNNANIANDIKNYGTPVDDIRKAIGIADRFLFQRELFGNDQNAFNQTLDTINSLTSFDEAHQYLCGAFAWDESDPTVDNFIHIVHRRFINAR